MRASSVHQVAAVLWAILWAVPCVARTLEAGPGKEFAGPSAAIAAAQDGDTVLIEPGTYFDCAVVPQNGLLIAGRGPGVILTDRPCQGKALLVIGGDGVTVRDLVLARLRVSDGNGAGIRLEAPNLLVQRVTFDNDQVGILSGSSGGSIRVEDSTFSKGGVGGDRPLYAVLAGNSSFVRVANSTFRDVAGGQISSAADRTEIVGNAIQTGTGDGAGPAVQVVAGTLTLEDNVITVGPNLPRRGAAVALWDDATGTLHRNRLVNQTGQSITLLQDWSWGRPTVADNLVGSGDQDVISSGVWRHRASSQFRTRKAEARALAGQLKRFVKEHLWP